MHAVCIYVCKCPCVCGKPEENGGGPAYHTLPKSLSQELTVELGWLPANHSNPSVSTLHSVEVAVVHKNA